MHSAFNPEFLPLQSFYRKVRKGRKKKGQETGTGNREKEKQGIGRRTPWISKTFASFAYLAVNLIFPYSNPEFFTAKDAKGTKRKDRKQGEGETGNREKNPLDSEDLCVLRVLGGKSSQKTTNALAMRNHIGYSAIIGRYAGRDRTFEHSWRFGL
jgi:hypothetical protein